MKVIVRRLFRDPVVVVLVILGVCCTDHTSGGSTADAAFDSSTSRDSDAPGDASDACVPIRIPTRPDSGKDESPKLSFGCIEGWPEYTPPKPVASLSKPRLELLGSDVPDALDGGIVVASYGSPATYWGGRLGLSAGEILVSYNVLDRTWAFSDFFYTMGVASPPAIRRNVPGGFVTGRNVVAGFRVDFEGLSGEFDPGGLPDWSFELGIGQQVAYSMLVHPDGTLYLTTNMRTIRAITPNGASIWEVSKWGTSTYYPESRFGLGDRVFVSGVGYHRKSGEEFDLPRFNGRSVRILGATYSRRLIGQYRGQSHDREYTVLLDECGTHQATIPTFPDLFVYDVAAVGFNNSVLFTGVLETAQRPVHFLVDTDGTVLSEPKNIARDSGCAQRLALGGDGIWYFAVCKICDGMSGDDLSLVALSPSLDIIDELDIGDSCYIGDATLLDDGTMLLARGANGYKLEFLRIATSSPGLARTAWPKAMRDNERTGWIAGW